MEFYYLKNNLIVATLLLAVLIGATRYRSMSTSVKMFWLLTLTMFLSEAIAYYAAIKYRNNLGVYGISSLAGIFVTCLYFNYSIPLFRKYGIGIIIGIISVFVGVLCNFYLQKPATFPSYFLHYQSLLIIALALFSLTKMLVRKESYSVRHEVHFWICFVLIFFWSTTNFGWALLEYYTYRFKTQSALINLSMFSINFITNVSIVLIFLFDPKMNKHGG